MSQFVHLHNHTHYSLLDATATPETLVKAAVADGQTAIALTDHGVMFGAMEFYQKAKKSGIKPIIGCEVYVANGSRYEKSSGRADSKKKNYYHLVLLAKNDIGYRNLIKLTSLAHTEGYYYKPRIDNELIEQHHEGLIALSACLGGVVGSHITTNDLDTAYSTAKWYQQLFGEDFYLELQNHFLPFDPLILEHVPKIAKEFNIPLIATNDCHYVKKEHSVAHNIYLLIKDITASTSGSVDIHKLRYGTPEFYVKSQQEMAELFKDFPDALANTLQVADKCNFDFPKGLHFPNFPIPKESKATDLDEYLYELTYQGAQERYGKTIPPDAQERLDFELGVIKKMGYSGYFLIVQDFIRAARKMGVSVGPGRGSAAGSLVAYALTITNVDPIKYDLLFERFLNPDRVSMPDIDIDFNDEKREMIIEYCRQKYGEECVAQIITFGTLKSKAALKDVARVIGIPPATVASITEHIPTIMGKVMPIKEAMELPELRWVKEAPDPKVKQLFEYAQVLEDLCRNSSLHAAGVVITPGAVSDFVPLYKTPSSGLATQYTMKYLEDAGLLKMDFLGLRTLSIIDNTVDMIRRNHNITIDVDALDLEDPKTYKLIGEGRTLAVFQFESEPMQDALKKLKPANLEDLTAMNALYRPGPMDNIPDFIDRKHGRKVIEYLHPSMENSLKNTYGIIVYQEQVMQLVRDLAGFSLAQADLMRRAMGKKDEKLMQEQKTIFIQGAQEKGIDEKKAAEIFDLILKFASYGFNKSHSLAYSYLAYQTAWLKAHYPAEFLAANMTAELNDLDKIVGLIDEAKYFGIEVLPPDVNESQMFFTAIDTKKIRFGLAAIKNVGEKPVESIITARKQQKFVSFLDFVARVDSKTINRRVLEALICSGAFDGILKEGQHRAQLFQSIDTASGYANALANSKSMSMDSLFGDDVGASVPEPTLPQVEPWSYQYRLKKEKELLSFYVSGHPLERYRAHVASFTTLKLGDKNSPLIGKPVRACGIITAVRTKLDKREKTMAFVTIEDFYGKAECIFWSDSYSRFSQYLYEDAVLLFVGKSELGGSDSLKIIIDDVMPIEEAPSRYASGLRLVVQREATDVALIEAAYHTLQSFPGKGSLEFSVYDQHKTLVKRYSSRSLKVTPSHDVAMQMMALFGSKNVNFVLE